MEEIIYISKPSITALEIEYVNDAIKNGWASHCYDYIYKFQTKFGNYLGTKNNLAVSSCTGAIHLAFMAIGLKPNDEVIVPDITWIASVAPITYIGAKPVFVDILEDTWCIDPAKIEAAITPNTKAIMPVHVYGSVCDMDAIMKIAKKHNLYVIEDAAEALGSEYKGQKVGSIGDIGVFSFHGTKTMTTGEGGMLCTNNSDLFSKACILNDHGRDPKIPIMFYMEQIGHKYKISNLQAALGLAQIERIEELVNRKREIFHIYQKLIDGRIDNISLNIEQAGTKNSYWMPTIIFDKKINIDRDKLFAFLKEKNVDYRPFFKPLSSLPMFSNVNNEISYSINERGMHLPTYHDITDAQQEYVINVIVEYLGL